MINETKSNQNIYIYMSILRNGSKAGIELLLDVAARDGLIVYLNVA